MLLGAAPSALSFTADPCAFAALGGEDVGMTGVLVAPAQMRLQRAGERDVAENQSWFAIVALACECAAWMQILALTEHPPPSR